MPLIRCAIDVNAPTGIWICIRLRNTGRLSIPALCVGAGKWSLKIAREWSNVRVQWGKPVGEHEAVGKKIAYIAASTFALEAVFELSAALADAGMKDVRIEAALAKLFASEVACTIADELLQIRGGRVLSVGQEGDGIHVHFRAIIIAIEL